MNTKAGEMCVVLYRIVHRCPSQKYILMSGGRKLGFLYTPVHEFGLKVDRPTFADRRRRILKCQFPLILASRRISYQVSEFGQIKTSSEAVG